MADNESRSLVPAGRSQPTDLLTAALATLGTLHEAHRRGAGYMALNIAAEYIGHLGRSNKLEVTLDQDRKTNAQIIDILAHLTAERYLRSYMSSRQGEQPDAEALSEVPEKDRPKEPSPWRRLRRGIGDAITSGLDEARSIVQDTFSAYRHSTHTSVADEIAREAQDRIQKLKSSARTPERLEELNRLAQQYGDELANTALPIGQLAGKFVARDATEATIRAAMDEFSRRLSDLGI